MKLDIKQIKVCIALTLLAIVIGQGIWIYNMYQTYRYQLHQAIDRAIETAILKEHSNRHEQMGGTIVSVPLTNHQDTARYIIKTIELQDTSFQVTLDRFDPYSDTKVSQFILKDHLPVNVSELDNIFRQELFIRGFPNAKTNIEYIDLSNNRVLNSLHSKSDIKAYKTAEIKTIDIFNTLGIMAYAQIPVSSILYKMTFQLLLSFSLISICVFFLFAIVKTLFWREKVELMRQESINSMTHEFKRPISSAVAHIALIPYYLEKGDADKAILYSENTLLELNKLTLYTERIQRISSDVNTKLSLNKVLVYLPNFFDRVNEKYAEVPEKKIDLKIDLNTAFKHLTMDLLHMSNVIDNLIENAIKYSKDELSILINIEDVKEGLLIQVKDNGIGISKSEIPSVFKKYFRSGSGPYQPISGFGLGLTYCKLVVEEHGGSISVESELGIGSVFSVMLPIQS